MILEILVSKFVFLIEDTVKLHTLTEISTILEPSPKIRKTTLLFTEEFVWEITNCGYNGLKELINISSIFL